MKKINREELEKFIFENQDSYMLISSDARFENGEATMLGFEEESTLNLYIQQNARKELLRFRCHRCASIDNRLDEMDIAYYIDDYLLEHFEDAEIKLI